MSEKLDKIAKKYGIKVKDLNAENYVKGGLKFVLMDDKEALKEVEKSIGADAIAEASKKETKKLPGNLNKEELEQIKNPTTKPGKTKSKANPGDAGGSTEKSIKLGKGKYKVDTKTGEIVKLAKGGFPDLSGDGKITQKDILMGKGVIKMKKGGIVKKKSSRTRIAKRGFGIAKRGY